MKIARLIVIAFAIGFAFGWFTLRIPFIANYHKARASFRWSADDYIKMITSPEEVFELTVPQAKMSHVIALNALRSIEADEKENAEKLLVNMLAGFYNIHFPPEQVQEWKNETRKATQLAIHSAIERHPALKEKIEEKIEHSREK